MASKYQDYHIGIDYGTSFSCVGVFMNGTVQIVPNKIGERTTPSIVCFTDANKDKAIVGEETLSQKIDNYKNTIYEVKRFIGLSYDEFISEGFDKHLNYDIVNKNGIPKIEVKINDQKYYYSAVEISSFIIKKLVECAEDFIAENGEGIKLTKAIITVPAHFRDDQKEAVKKAAQLAGIEVPRIINEPTAAAVAYGIGINLVPENINSKNTLIINKREDSNEAPLAIERIKSKSKENAIVFDLGGGTLDITLLNISKNKEGIINFEVEASDGDTHLGGSDFDNKLIDYCIQEFCKDTSYKIEDVKSDKKACKRLKIKCENAKKYLSISKETVINIDSFYGNEDLVIKMNRDLFNDLCKDIYQRIEDLIFEILGETAKETIEIDEIILVGGATRMPGIKDLLKRLFGEDKVKNNLNPDEAVAFGATMQAAKIEENDKIPFTLQDINAYNIGIAVTNPDPNDFIENGFLMNPIIKMRSKIPSYSEKTFRIELKKENPVLAIKIYEGKSKYINNNSYLGEMSMKLNQIGIIEYNLKFNIDVNSQLTATITIDSLGIKKEEIIKKVTLGFLDEKGKKIKICKTKDLKPISILMDSIKSSKQKLSEVGDNTNKLNYLSDCCQSLEDLIENYTQFINVNETVYEKIYMNIKDLFNCYIERIKLMGQGDKNVKNIINKIRDYMKILIPSVAFLEDLLEMFSEIKLIYNLRNVFFEIFINFMELMNLEGISKKEKQNKKFQRYYSKLYFEREFYASKKYIKSEDISNMNKELKERYEKQRKINEEELKKVNSFTNFIEDKIKLGKFLYGKTGFTVIGKKIEKYEKDLSDMTVDEVREILDIFENMADSFDKKENSIGEAYCLSHIIIINYKLFKRGYEKLWEYINRLKAILFSKENVKYDWITEVKKIMEEIDKNQDKNN